MPGDAFSIPYRGSLVETCWEEPFSWSLLASFSIPYRGSLVETRDGILIRHAIELTFSIPYRGSLVETLSTIWSASRWPWLSVSPIADRWLRRVSESTVYRTLNPNFQYPLSRIVG